MSRRDWWWLRTRIEGLLCVPPQFLLLPDGVLVTSHQTRIAAELEPPVFTKEA